MALSQRRKVLMIASAFTVGLLLLGLFVMMSGLNKKWDTRKGEENQNLTPSVASLEKEKSERGQIDPDHPPQFIQAQFVELGKVFAISKFRSGMGHDYSSLSGETCRSMKHYFTSIDPSQSVYKYEGLSNEETPAPTLETDVKIFAPVDGTLSIGATELVVTPDAYPQIAIRLQHVFAAPGVQGGQVQAGQVIGLVLANQSFDLAIEATTGSEQAKKIGYISYFAALPDELFSAFQARGVESRDNLIISRESRDAHPYSCHGKEVFDEYYLSTEPFEANRVALSGFAEMTAQIETKYPNPDILLTRDTSDQTLDKVSGPAPSVESLPELSSFLTHPADRFIVDLNSVTAGHPYLSKRAARPHSGAHVQYQNADGRWPEGTPVDQYPPIYAVADGYVDRITPSLRVGSNDRYGINIAIARQGGTVWTLEYSIEPMAPEPSPGFYAPFMLVREGERVYEGQAIGFIYVPEGVDGTHIHFELITSGQPRMAVLAIFSPALVADFATHWGPGSLDGGIEMPVCMGWMIDAEENPFGTGASDCL